MFLDFIEDLFCNKYVDVIWHCTFKLRVPLYNHAIK
jgi:hypothetical protein